jgi:hypothetical protein
MCAPMPRRVAARAFNQQVVEACGKTQNEDSYGDSPVLIHAHPILSVTSISCFPGVYIDDGLEVFLVRTSGHEAARGLQETDSARRLSNETLWNASNHVEVVCDSGEKARCSAAVTLYRAAGRMFWLTRKTFAGSYFVFNLTKRS